MLKYSSDQGYLICCFLQLHDGGTGQRLSDGTNLTISLESLCLLLLVWSQAHRGFPRVFFCSVFRFVVEPYLCFIIVLESFILRFVCFFYVEQLMRMQTPTQNCIRVKGDVGRL